MATSEKTRTFEEVVGELKRIVERLEDQDVPLEEGLALYEKGMKLAKEAETILEKARTRLKELTSEGLRDSDIA